MRNSKKFHSLLLQYEATSIAKRTSIFWNMKKEAKTFADWSSIYQYAGDSIRKDAQREMERLVLRGSTVFDIQLNILELFIIIDQEDKCRILERYLKKHHDKDDLLFVASLDDEQGLDTLNKLAKYYKRLYNVNKGIYARRRKSYKMLEEFSTFNPWHEIKKSQNVYMLALFSIFLWPLYRKQHLQLEQVIQKFHLPPFSHAHYFYYDMK